MNKLYRYEDALCPTGVDEYGDLRPAHVIKIMLREYTIIKCTPQGAWIHTHGLNGRKRFVLLTARKQYASTTKNKALVQFKMRKKKQIEILETKLKRAKEALNLADRLEI